MFTSFNATHVIMTELDKAETNGIKHFFKFGTEVELIKCTPFHLVVVNARGSVQYVELSDVRLMTEYS